PNQGRQARSKQSDPAPLADGGRAHPGAPERKGKRKLVAEAKAERAGPAAAASPRANKRVKQDGRAAGGGRGGAAAAAAGKGKGKEQKKQAAKPKNGREVDWESDDDIEGLKADDDMSNDEELDDEEQKRLASARSALFDDVDLEEPGAGGDFDDDEFDLDRADDEDDLDDEFDLDEEEGALADGIVEGNESNGQSSKAAKRAARAAAYNSDEEEEADDDEPLPAGLDMRRLEPEAIEGQIDATMEELEGAKSDDEDDDDSDDENLQQGQLEDLRAVEKRMRTAARVLSHWKQLGPATGLSRSEVVDQLLADICQYHGYTPFLAEKLFEIFSVEEALEFFTASDTPRPLTIRVNTLKTRRRDLAQALINRGVNLEPLEGGWSKVGLQVFSGSSVPIGATPEYLAGHYILQAASSFLPVMALDPQPHERCLDMSAAPGGKTTYMSALMGNTGEVWANDSSRGRIKGLGGNVARLGCRNVVITNVDGREFPKIMGGFDRVLLDAPCSGTGVISKDQSVKVNKTERDFMLLSHLQKQLLLCAIDSTKTGGHVVYSTCSIMPDENESVVTYALRKRPHVKLVDTGLPFGREGFKSFRGKQYGKGIEHTRRYYPHVQNIDGFYVAKFYIGSPSSAKKTAEPVSPTLPYAPLPMTDDAEADETAADAPTFDDAEDTKLIDETRKRQLKKKGLNPRADKAKAGKKAARPDDE
ncbi:NOL1/NOP2/sun family putative RNA met, partial [Rhodotorula sp. JG-1b]